MSRAAAGCEPATWAEAFARHRREAQGDHAGPHRRHRRRSLQDAEVDEGRARTCSAARASPNLDCRQDGAALEPVGRARAGCSTRPSPASTRPTRLLIVAQSAQGSAGAQRPHPQALAAPASLKIGVIGEHADLTYRLRASRRRRRDAGDARRTQAVRQGAARRPSGRRSSGRARWRGRTARRCSSTVAKAAVSVGALADGWNGFNVLHTAAARVGGLDLGFVPGRGRPRRARQMVAKGGARRAVPARRRRDRPVASRTPSSSTSAPMATPARIAPT